MTTIQIALLIFGFLAALGLAAFTYTRREPRGRGRPLLIALRTLAIMLIILLLLDPGLSGGRARRGGGTRVVLDASLSMQLGGPGHSAWERALAQARRLAGDQPVLLAGSAARSVPADSLAALVPHAGESRILPALQSAAEAGAERVVLLTDGALEDVDAVARWLPTLGVAIDVQEVAGAAVANRAVRDVDAPAWAEAGKPITIRAGVVANALTGSHGVVVRQNGNQVARADVELATDGVASTTLTFTANGPAQGGFVRYDVAFERADAIPDDDVRSIYVFISEKPAGVVLVSFDPDWEPRFLHPVVQNALGLPMRTFLRVPAGTYFRGGNALEAGGQVDESLVRRAVGEADLLILHGFGPRAPAWAQDVARKSRRLIVFPAREAIDVPLAMDAAAEADWYVSPEVPPSPIASLLAGIDAANLPPLNSLHNADAPDAAWAPLFGGRTRRGGRSALVLAGEVDGRRWVVALGTGYWRWAFRGGAARDAYTRLWASLAGWVAQDQAQVAAAAIRPVSRSVPRATPLRWIASGIAADSFVLALRAAGGDTVRAVMTAERGDTAASAAPPPGHYAYDVRGYGEGQEIARATGALTVETYSAEFTRRRVDLGAVRKPAQALAGTARVAGRPLHTYSWLYVVLVALLSVEWILRRRWGLR